VDPMALALTNPRIGVDAVPDRAIYLEENAVREIGKPGSFGEAVLRTDLGGRGVTQGEIDPSVHVHGVESDPPRGGQIAPGVARLQAGQSLETMLQPGFTVVRDVAGWWRNVCAGSEVLCAAAAIGVELISMGGRFRTIAARAFAGLLVTDGNPLRRVTIFEIPDEILQTVRDGGDSARTS